VTTLTTWAACTRQAEGDAQCRRRVGEGLTFGGVGTVEAGPPHVSPVAHLADERTVAAYEVADVVGLAGPKRR
jgi:hypothetical protein